MIQFRPRRLSFVLGLVFLSSARAGSAPPAAGGWIARTQALASAAEVTAARYPDADWVVVEGFTRASYHPDGTGETWDEEYFKVLTEKGRRERQTLSFHFALPYETSAVVRAEVIKADGRVLDVDVSRQSRAMVEPSQMGQNIYDPNRKVLQLTVPGLETGDVCYVLSHHVTMKPRVPDTWSDYTVLEYTAPLKRIVYEVLAPRDRPLVSMAARDEVPGTLRHAREELPDGSLRYRWEVRDVPRMFEEPNMPPLYTVVQRVLVSTIPDWATISRWYWNLSLPHLEAVTPEMKALVAQLTEGAESRQDRIERLFRWVSQQIRYMGITTETEAPGYEPHDVSMTFENRHGVCRDKAALLVALLRLAEVPAYPALIHTGPKKDEEVPQPYFNHAIVAAESESGDYILMDPTDENTRELLPAYLCNKSYLVAHPRGERLRTSPIIPASENLLRIRTTGTLGEGGRLDGETVLEFGGVNDNAYRGYFARLKPIERRRFFENRVKDRIPGARLTSFVIEPDDIQDTTQPLIVRLGYEAEGVLMVGSDRTLLPPLWLGTEIGYVNFVLGQTGLERRRYPLLTDVACGVEETLDLNLSDAVGPAVSLPDYQALSDPLLSFEPRAEIAPTNRLRAEMRFLIHAVEFSTNDYRRLKEALKTMEYQRRMMPVFDARPDAASGPDWRVQSDEITVRLEDARTWSLTRATRATILTYAGIKRASELKFSFNPVWSDVHLDQAAVTSPTGRVQTVTPEAINLMDAAWVGSAPRYPPEKTLVVSLPGVEVGSTIEYRVTQVFRDHPFFSFRQSFRGFEPAERQRLELLAPRGLPLRVETVPDSSVPVRRESGPDGERWLWEAENLPAVTKEENLPPWWSFTPTALVSAGDWSAWAAEAQAALQAAARRQPRARERARALVREARTPAERLVAIRDFVARAVRLAGPAFPALPLACVTPADRTLAEGYGNTADRAVVLHAMLEAAGFRPQFVLASSWAPRDAGLTDPLWRCPQRDLFNSVLVVVDIEGRRVVLNDTDQYASLGATAHDGRTALDARGDRITIQAWPERRTRLDADYDIELTPDGDARMAVCVWHSGLAFAEHRKRFSEMPPEERRRFYREMAADISQAAEPASDLVTDYEQDPGKTMFLLNVPRWAVRSGPYLYFRLPRPAFPLFPPLPGERRDLPLYLEGPLERTARYRIVFPDSAVAVELMPPPVLWTGPQDVGTVRVDREIVRSVSRGRLMLEVTLEASLREAVVPPQAYPTFLDAERQLKHPGAATVMVRLAEDQPREGSSMRPVRGSTSFER